jgi:hypothetical protein
VGLLEGKDYDRVTLSGLFGPVHWLQEQHPAVLTYDFVLNKLASQEHLQYLRMRTATVLGVIMKKYDDASAYLPSRAYRAAFGPVVETFDVSVFTELEELGMALAEGKKEMAQGIVPPRIEMKSGR